jgi:hypothetical protein
VIALARSPDWGKRVGAAAQLAALDSPDADVELGRLLRDENTAVIDAAAEALLNRGNESGIRVVLKALVAADDESGEHILWMVSTAHHEGGPVLRVIKALAQDKDQAVNEGAEIVLAWLTP